MKHVVIDTNVLVSSLSSKSKYHRIITLILNGDINLYLTDEILLEYEEIISLKYSSSTSTFFIHALKELPNVFFVKIYYYWQLLNDEDDNKFSDCYIASPATILVTNDKGFNKLKNVDFPKIFCLTIEDYLNLEKP
jgi:uncharacterized protein